MTASFSMRAVVVLATAARVTLGILWANEAVLKYRAGFGAADILLVADSTSSNTRVAPWFQLFTTHVMAGAPALFGVAVPLLELALGLALVVGVGTRLAAVGSVVQLTLYWSSDQLIAQYPIMLVLALVVLCTPVAATRWSLSALVLRRRRVSPRLAVWL